MARTFASRLKQAVKASPLDMIDIQSRSRVNISTIERWMKGERTNPETAMLVPVARTLNVTVEWLWTGRV